jgi:hypothetical protein
MTDAASTTATPGAGAATVTAGAAAAAPANNTPAAQPAAQSAPAAAPSTTTASPAGDGGAAAKPAAPSAAPAATESKPVDAARTSLLADTAKPASPSGEQNGQQSDATPSSDAAASAPYDIKLPETLKVTDQKEFDALKGVLKETGLPAEKAPKLVEFLATKKSELESAALQRQYDVWDSTQKEWQDKVMADPDVGGDKWPTVSAQLGSLIDEFGKDIPTLRQTLTFTGAGNHPDLVKFLYNVSEALKEGGIVQANKNAAQGKPKSKASRLYDNTGA